MSITTPAPKFNIVRTFLYGRCIPCAERRRTEWSDADPAADVPGILGRRGAGV